MSESMSPADDALDRLVEEIRACRLCLDRPKGRPLAHLPRPVLRPSRTARILVASQAPGTRVHASGVPFTDPSGVRLRSWMGVSPEEFYDTRRIAIVPMGFCFPGQSPAGADLPPRRECAPAWRARLMALMPQIELVLAVGAHAIVWHLPEARGVPLADIVAHWPELLAAPRRPRVVPLPHPSWRNNAWLKRHSWFEAELLPALRAEIRRLLGEGEEQVATRRALPP